jgi:hypothetical protein
MFPAEDFEEDFAPVERQLRASLDVIIPYFTGHVSTLAGPPSADPDWMRDPPRPPILPTQLNHIRMCLEDYQADGRGRIDEEGNVRPLAMESVEAWDQLTVALGLTVLPPLG